MPRGVYGRRPPKNAPALRASRFLTGIVPEHPVAVDWIAKLGGGWLMLGNDRAGCCVGVTWATIRRILTALLGGAEKYPSQDLVWEVYRTQNPGFDPNGTADTNGPGSDHDQGMDIQTLLEFLHANPGMFDGGELLAFAKVDPGNTEEVTAADAIFGPLWTGLMVTEANETEFDRSLPWDYVARSQQVGGHSVAAAGYSPPKSEQGALAGRVKFETWMEESSFTDELVAHQVDEMWVTIWSEHLGTTQFEEGVNQDALKAAYQELTGRVLVLPDPPPSPPNPVPDPVDPPVTLDLAVASFLAVAGPWAAEHRTRPDLVKIQAAIKALEAAAQQ